MPLICGCPAIEPGAGISDLHPVADRQSFEFSTWEVGQIDIGVVASANQLCDEAAER